MKKMLLSMIVMVALSACSEVELGSHVAKSLYKDGKPPVGDFKVGNPYKIKGRNYYPSEKYRHSETGVASWYGPGFHGKLTANGEIFDKYALTAAHRTLQMPSIVRVTNLENGRSIIVRVNDRGPFAHDRIIDLSEKAAETLRMKNNGTARVRVDVLEKESRMVASAAKKGLSTSGTEIAFNQGKSIRGMEMEIATPASKPISSQPIIRSQPVRVAKNTVIPEQKLFSQVLTEQTQIPADTITRKPLQPVQRVVVNNPSQQQNYALETKPTAPVASSSQEYFIQTGAFAQEDNALTMKSALYNISEPVHVYRSIEQGTPIYKVKIGPIQSVEKTDEIVTLLQRQGRNATVLAQN